MALAESTHHTSRCQRFARAGEEGREEHDALRRQRPPSSPAGALPAVQGRRARRFPTTLSGWRRSSSAPSSSSPTSYPWCRFWRLLGGDQVVEVLRMLDVPVIEQVIAVPKIFLDRVPQRSALRRAQKAEQLVEVPTDPGYSLAVIAVQAIGLSAAMALAEQIVDNPVPQIRRGGGGGLQGFRAGQGSPAADMEQIVEFPVPLGRPQGSLPGRGSTANLGQIVDFPARGGLHGFFPGQGSSSSSRFLQGFQRFFRTFPQPQKMRRLPASRVRECLPVSVHPS